MRISKLTLVAAGIALPAILFAQAGAAGPNYVVNGDFSQGLTDWPDWDWQKSNVTVTADERLSIESLVPVAAGTYDSVAQCLAIPSDEHSYLVEADLFLPAGQGRSGYLNIEVQSYEGPCELPAQPQWIGGDDFYGAGINHAAGFQVTPLPGATHLRLKVGVGTISLQPGDDPDATLQAFFDNVSVTAIGYEPPADDPQDPPADDPTSPADDPTSPADDPTPPADDPTPPADDPTPPADDPTPPADDPTPPADDPTPPAVDPTPPAVDPTPPAEDPSPPADDPSPQAGTTLPADPGTPGNNAAPADTSEQVAPAPPSTGTGLSTSASTSLPLIAGLSLTALATTLGAFAAAGARMKRR